MADPAKQENQTRCVTGKVRLSYAFVWETNKDGKYATSIIIDKNDKATIDKINACVAVVKASPKALGKWGGKVPPSLKLPLRDGDIERDTEEYVGKFFLNCSSKNAPGIVDANVEPIIDKAEVYSGCYARVSLNFYPFNEEGNRGIAVGLGNIQKLADGEPLAGSSKPEDDFGPAGEDEDFMS
jgi:hypothetical protein